MAKVSEHTIIPQLWSSFVPGMVVFLTLWTTVTAPLILICGIYVVYRWSAARKTSQWRKCGIPFSPPSFPLGHAAFSYLNSQSPLVAFDRIYRENADRELVGFFATSCPFILIRDPHLIQKIFVKNFGKAFQTGIVPPEDDTETQFTINFCSDRNVWKRSRKIMAPVFSATRMAGSNFAKLTTQVKRMWQHTERTTLQGKPIKAQLIARNFVVDFTSSWHFGEASDSYQATAQIERICHTYYEPKIRRLLAFWAQVHAPSLQTFELFRFTSQNSKNVMAKFLRHKIYQDTSVANRADGYDFVDLLRCISRKGCQNNLETSTHQQKNEGLNIRQMIGLSFVLLVAGTDAVASLCHFALHLLSLHPRYQERIQREIDQVMERHGAHELTLSVVEHLEFLEQCLMETLRLYPSLFAIMRTCSENFNVPGTQYNFKKGDKLMIIPYSINRDPKYFKDPDNFDPERFSPEKKGSISPETFLTFGIGPRKCPGSLSGVPVSVWEPLVVLVLSNVKYLTDLAFVLLGYRIGLNTAATFVASLLCKYTLKPLSHLRQLEAADFDPFEFTLQYARKHILINLEPRIVPMTAQH